MKIKSGQPKHLNGWARLNFNSAVESRSRTAVDAHLFEPSVPPQLGFFIFILSKIWSIFFFSYSSRSQIDATPSKKYKNFVFLTEEDSQR